MFGRECDNDTGMACRIGRRDVRMDFEHDLELALQLHGVTNFSSDR
jgi:hypothetical protein